MMWIHTVDKTSTNETMPERLRREANELDREAKSMIGCTWLGDGPPWLSRQQDAADKRLLATLLKDHLS